MAVMLSPNAAKLSHRACSALGWSDAWLQATTRTSAMAPTMSRGANV